MQQNALNYAFLFRFMWPFKPVAQNKWIQPKHFKNIYIFGLMPLKLDVKNSAGVGSFYCKGLTLLYELYFCENWIFSSEIHLKRLDSNISVCVHLLLGRFGTSRLQQALLRKLLKATETERCSRLKTMKSIFLNEIFHYSINYCWDP